ncbi:hypothetical protein NEOLEDRAFT_1079198 [Neolentinus lepideus HHB14362 ss-1]|uniref:Alpha/beta hydrolase fold-3 domain-containing protein n=1 Tax=Neolentinus lepideus HHB14362 ss-1 TaxID=1314782 RepID=A0A165MVT4_9AGAM|nr:hypothetical protein NEOLEDRAFT_1079198 [Neolentinus lepideus HHB14362 ss-1]
MIESLYRVQDHKISVEGGTITARSVRPVVEEGKTALPLIVWFHSGGWMNGDMEMDDFWLRNVCVDLRVSILNVEYRLAPEYRFPISVNDTYAAVKWAADHTEMLGASLEKGFIVAGASAGANMAAVTAHRALKDPFFADKKITGHALQIPALCHTEAYPDKWKAELLSSEQNKDSPAINRATINNIQKALQAPATDPDFSVLLAAHDGLPPLYLQICGMDPLRDESFLYEKLLRDRGIKTNLDVYPGVPHNFHRSLPDIKAAVKFDSDFREGMRWLLSTVV